MPTTSGSPKKAKGVRPPKESVKEKVGAAKLMQDRGIPNRNKVVELMAEAHDPQFAAAEGRHAGLAKRKKINWELLNRVGTMLILQHTRSEIFNAFSGQHAVSHIQRYITMAHRRMRWLARKSQEQVISESLSYWARMLQRSELRLQRSEKELEARRKELAEIDEFILAQGPLADVPPAQKVRVAHLLSQKYTARIWCVEAMDRLASEIRAAKNDGILARTQTDKLLGSYAPLKIAQTDAEGRTLKQVKARPLSQEEIAGELVGLIADVRARAEESTQN